MKSSAQLLDIVPTGTASCSTSWQAPFSTTYIEDYCSARGLTAYAEDAGNLVDEPPPDSPSDGEVGDVALSQYERSILLFNLRVGMVPEGAEPQPITTMTRAMEMVRAAWRAGEAHMRVGDYLSEEEGGSADDSEERERPNLLSIKDIHWADDGVVTILFRLCGRNP